MTITSRILESIQEGNIKSTNDAIDFLIDDEKEAIKGYTDMIDKIQEINDLGPAANDKFVAVTELFGHIILEEKEHIKELEELKEKLGL